MTRILCKKSRSGWRFPLLLGALLVTACCSVQAQEAAASPGIVQAQATGSQPTPPAAAAAAAAIPLPAPVSLSPTSAAATADAPASVYAPQPPTRAENVLLPGTPAAAIALPAAAIDTPAIPIASNAAAVGAYTGNIEPTIWKKLTMLLIGDSLTEMGLNADGGWTVRMASAYSRKADILNRGFGGYTSSSLLLALPEILDSVKNQKVILATVWLGANDASMPDRGNAAANVPIDTYMKNLRSIITQLQDAGVLNVVLITPPPVWEGAPAAIPPGQTLPHRTYNYTSFYAAAVRAVATQVAVPVLDMWQWVDAYDGWRTNLMLPDGLHLNSAGQEVMYNALMKMIQDQVPQVQPASLPWHHPTWWFIDYKNADQQFAAEQAAYAAAHAPAAGSGT